MRMSVTWQEKLQRVFCISSRSSHLSLAYGGMRSLLLALVACSARSYQLPSRAVSFRSSSSATRQIGLPVVRMEAAGDTAPVPAVTAPAAHIEFIEGYPEPCVPDVSLTRSRDGSTGVATFTFDNPTFLSAASEALGETTGMYLKVCAAAAALATAWPY